MNTTCSETRERLQTVHGPTAQGEPPSPWNADATQRDPLWIPDDIAEPESWTLASFSDLLPHETA